MTPDSASAGLIIDLGMSEGHDTAFYLDKGFRVLGVEADVEMVAHIRHTFARAISSGRLRVLNFAATSTFGDTVEFFKHTTYRGISGLERKPQLHDGYVVERVTTIDWNTVMAQWGSPYYLKADIQGQEAAFLSGMAGRQDRPEYISVECRSLEPVQLLFDLGYPFFRLIDQNPPGGFALPDVQTEGLTIERRDWVDSSGPFGTELPPGDWLSFGELVRAYHHAQGERSRTWFDCHAWMPRIKS